MNNYVADRFYMPLGRLPQFPPTPAYFCILTENCRMTWLLCDQGRAGFSSRVELKPSLEQFQGTSKVFMLLLKTLKKISLGPEPKFLDPS
jgi:hypothetical protein